MNIIKTGFLMVLMTIILVLAGGLLGGRQGVVISLIFAIVMNFSSYWFSDKIVLKIYHAREIERSDDPFLYDLVKELAGRASIPMPKVYICPQATPNAFATGRDPKHAAVAVTEGIRRALTTKELAGVIGHELAHVKHRDILIQSIVAVIAGAITSIAFFARWALVFGGIGSGNRENRGSLNILAYIITLIIAPIAATLIQLAISRSREYAADAGGAQISGNPLWLADALRKLQVYNSKVPMDASLSTAHIFIMNPLKLKGMKALFSTHPSTEDRIMNLEKMAGHLQ